MAEVVALTPKEKKRLYNIEYRRRNLEKEKQRYRAYYEQNKEKRQQYNREYGKKRYSKDKDTLLSECKARRLKNIDGYRSAQRERSRKFREESPALARSRVARWEKSNPDKVRVYNSRRRKKLANAEGYHTADELRALCVAQSNKCAICRSKFGKSVKKTLDHIIPLARGGSNWAENLQFLCRSCNSKKGARDPFDFARSIGMLL